MKFDYLIVGAGLSGSILAERLTSMNKKVLVVEKRNYIGGNCHDCFDQCGVLIHKHGPHYFRTNSDQVISYLSRFTDWIYFEPKIKASIDKKLYTIPINRDTLNQFFNVNLRTKSEARQFLEEKKVKIKKINNAEEQVISLAGQEIYDAFFKNYTVKQWDIHPKNLDPSVTARIPIRTNTDDRYFTDKFQGVPKKGYTKMIEKMLENCKVLLNTDYESIKNKILFDNLIYTGQIDTFFNYRYGKLPYRSLKIVFKNYKKNFYQDWVQINYPNNYKFTRIVEMKHATRQKIDSTTISKEYPTWKGDPYYPVPNKDNEQLYKKYETEAKKLKNVYFIGRLAEYKYLNMDQVIEKSLNLFKEIINKK